MSFLRKFFISFSHFFAGKVLLVLAGFISFPILTRVLTKEEYGILGLTTNTMFLAVAIAKAGLSDGIVRFYQKYSETSESLDQFTSTIAVRGFLLSVFTVLSYIMLFPKISVYLNIKRQYLACFMIMGGYLLINPLNIIVLNLLRITGKTFLFNVINLVGKVTSIGMSLFFLLFLIKEFYGYFVGLVVSELIVSLILFYWFFSNYRVALSKISGSLAMKLIKFGFPLLITELSYLLLLYADRYMIMSYKGGASLGLYSVGYNIAAYISEMMMFSLSYSVVPIYVEIYEKEGREKTEEFLQKCMHYLLIVITPLYVGFLAVSKDLFVVLASEKYTGASIFSPVILLGLLFLGLNTILNAGLYLEKKSKVILLIMLSAMMINVSLNVFLIPRYDLTGAAIATLIACIWTTILTVVLSFKYITVKVDVSSIIYYITFSCIMFFVIMQVHTPAIWMDLMTKIMTGIFVIALAVLIKEREIFTKMQSFFSLKKFR